MTRPRLHRLIASKERAEIEAVARALDPNAFRPREEWPAPGQSEAQDAARRAAEAAIEALDRARDARDDNNGRCRTCGDWVGPDGCERCARYPQGEDQGRKVHRADCEWVTRATRCTCGIGIGPLSRREDHGPEPDALGGQRADGG